MTTEFIQIKTSDDLTLPGKLYSTSNSKKAAIYIHGNGSSSIFYQDDSRVEFAEAFSEIGISFLEFNNRGANYVKNLYFDGSKDAHKFGMAYELIKDCIIDIDAAIDYLDSVGFEEFYLVGESTGANKICVYDYYEKKNRIKKYILLAGGDDVGIYYNELGDSKFYSLLKEAKEKINEGNGDQIITSLIPILFSYKSFYDIANPDGDYNIFPFYEVINNKNLSKTNPIFNIFKQLEKPALVVYGSEDEYCWGDVSKVVDILKKYNNKPDYHIINGADHVFSEHRVELANLMKDWLNKVEK